MTAPRQYQNQWFISSDGIALEVITADIQRYLGPNALVRPGKDAEIFGYWITASRNLTASMIEDLRRDSQRWQQERPPGLLRGPGEVRLPYQESQTHAARQYHGPTTPFDHSQPHTQAVHYTSLSDPQVPSQGYQPLTPGYNLALATPQDSSAGYRQELLPQHIPSGATTEEQAEYSYVSTSEASRRIHTASEGSSNPESSKSAPAPPEYFLASDGRWYPESSRAAEASSTTEPTETTNHDTEEGKGGFGLSQ